MCGPCCGGRRPLKDARARFAFGDIEIDTRTRDVHKAGQELRLTAKEFDLLAFLAGNPRRVFGRDQLMSRVWGYEEP